MRLLVVEDEPRISEIIKAALERAEFAVDTVRLRADAREALANTAYDAAILDLGLPDGDGLNLLAELRPAGSRIPILILTARDAVVDRVTGLETGADDYLVKPFALEELLARVKALLRRRNPPDITREVLVFEDLELDTATRQAKRGNRLIDLSTTEYELLAMFLRNSRIVLTRSVLMDRIWGMDFEGGPNVLEVYIGHLRNKLEQHGEKRLIQTVRGAGYVLRVAD